MKKRRRNIILFLSLIVICLICIQWVVPAILLNHSKPNDGMAKEIEELSYYIDSYDESLKRFSLYEGQLKKMWKDVEYEKLPVGDTGLTLDIIRADASEKKDNLLILTAGVHGVEGYAGSAMLDVVVQEFSKKMNPDHTGVILIHAGNPWGMKNFRRYNEDNVDLNRNFIYDWDSFDLTMNKDYQELNTFFEKASPIGNSTLHELGFLGSLATEAVQSGTDKITDALLNGQYTEKTGVYYGGTEDASSTKLLKQQYRKALESEYDNIVHIDLHTGYGPRDQMSIFSSVHEKMKQKQAEEAFQYPLVITPESDEFYATSGDNTEYFNMLQKEIAPNKHLYSTTFEFGTLGMDTVASIKSLKNTIDENRLYQNGTNHENTEEIIKNRYREMFYPTDPEWRIKAVKDFRQGLSGVLINREVMD